MPEKRPEWHTTLTLGECYLFTEVTSMIYVGRIIAIPGLHSVVLEDAAWISETGRLYLFMQNGTAEGMEIEPVGVQAVYWAGWRPWPHKLFNEVM